MNTWYPSATPYLTFYIYDKDGAVVDPTSVTVSIYDPNGVAVVTDGATSKISTGYYYYSSWTVPTAPITGKYTWIPKTTDGAIVIRDTAFYFEVQKEVGE